MHLTRLWILPLLALLLFACQGRSQRTTVYEERNPEDRTMQREQTAGREPADRETSDHGVAPSAERESTPPAVTPPATEQEPIPPSTPPSSDRESSGALGEQKGGALGEKSGTEKSGADSSKGRTVEVTALQMRFEPTEITAAPGETIVLKLTNRGDHEHSIEFVVPGEEKHPSLEKPVKPGETGSIELKAPQTPGTYTFFCPVGDHRQNGMEGKLIVRE